MRGITLDEKDLLLHISHWGRDGYPVEKLGRGWQWRQWRSVRGTPVVYNTKREAVAAFEAFLDILRAAVAGRL